MTVSTLFHCPYDSCSTANDNIKILLKEDGQLDYKEIFRLGTESGRKDRKWILEEFFFETQSSIINV